MGLRGILTTACQLSCVYCHQEGWPSKGCAEHYPKYVSTDGFIRCCTVSMRSMSYDVSLSGGEPLLHRELGSIISSLVIQGAAITVITNGQLLRDRISDLSKAASVHVSLPSSDPIEYAAKTGGAIELVIEGLERLRSLAPDTRLKINSVFDVSNESNASNIDELLRLCDFFGASLKLIARFDPHSKTSSSALHVLKKLYKRGYLREKWDGRTLTLNKLGSTPVEVTETACSAAHRHPNSCNICSQWGDLYIGVDCSKFICPWSNFGREEVAYCE